MADMATKLRLKQAEIESLRAKDKIEKAKAEAEIKQREVNKLRLMQRGKR